MLSYNQDMALLTRKEFGLACLVMAGVLVVIGFGYLVDQSWADGTRHASTRVYQASVIRLRKAIFAYYDDTGRWPLRLDDLIQEVSIGLPSISPNKTHRGWNGPYLPPGDGIAKTGIPRNPFASRNDMVIAHHWIYSSADGRVTSAVPLPKDLKDFDPFAPESQRYSVL